MSYCINKNRNIYCFYFFLCFIGLPFFANAEEVKKNEFFDMSLEELLKVSVASKHPESLLKAPSNVSVIQAKEIRLYGARNLRDLINRLPNTQNFGSATYPQNHTSMRGVTQTHLDDKILILLNGRPMRDAGQGGVNVDIYSAFPLTSIKQIEIIRGPGSALYGTNAFTGVINIITYNERELKTFRVDSTYGSFNTKQITLSGGIEGENKGLTGSFVSHASKGDSVPNMQGEIGARGVFESGKEFSTINVQGHYGDFILNALLDNTSQKNSNSIISFPSSDWLVDRRFIDIGYSTLLANEWQIKLNGTYNGLTNEAYFKANSDLHFTTRSFGYLFEAQAQHQYSDNLGLLIGAVYDKLHGDNLSNSADFIVIDTSRNSVYSKLDYKASSWASVSMGGQLNQAEGISQHFSPRFSTVFTLTDTSVLKVMYGEAYRSPFGLDLYVNSPLLKGNPHLKPEIINTSEIQLLTQNVNGSSYSFALYQSTQKDLIVRVRDASGIQRLVNDKKIDYQGAELTYEYPLWVGWSLQGNASYQINETLNDEKQTTFQPKAMVKMGVSYTAETISAGIFASHFGKPTPIENVNSKVKNVNPDATAYTLVTANFRWNFGAAFESKLWSDASLNLYVDNLLDEEIYFPEFNRQVVNTLPNGDGRGAYLTLEIPL